MTTVIVGKWGQDLAIRVPAAVTEAAGLSKGETVEIKAVHGDLTIRRSTAQAEVAAAEMEAESKHYRLDGVSIRALPEEGRRG